VPKKRPLAAAKIPIEKKNTKRKNTKRKNTKNKKEKEKDASLFFFSYRYFWALFLKKCK